MLLLPFIMIYTDAKYIKGITTLYTSQLKNCNTKYTRWLCWICSKSSISSSSREHSWMDLAFVWLGAVRIDWEVWLGAERIDFSLGDNRNDGVCWLGALRNERVCSLGALRNDRVCWLGALLNDGVCSLGALRNDKVCSLGAVRIERIIWLGVARFDVSVWLWMEVRMDLLLGGDRGVRFDWAIWLGAVKFDWAIGLGAVPITASRLLRFVNFHWRMMTFSTTVLATWTKSILWSNCKERCTANNTLPTIDAVTTTHWYEQIEIIRARVSIRIRH